MLLNAVPNFEPCGVDHRRSEGYEASEDVYPGFFQRLEGEGWQMAMAKRDVRDTHPKLTARS